MRHYEHQLFNDTNRGWLSLIIDVRDQVNHGIAGGMKIERFAVYRDASGTVHLPMWNDDQRIADAMVIVSETLFTRVTATGAARLTRDLGGYLPLLGVVSLIAVLPILSQITVTGAGISAGSNRASWLASTLRTSAASRRPPRA